MSCAAAERSAYARHISASRRACYSRSGQVTGRCLAARKRPTVHVLRAGSIGRHSAAVLTAVFFGGWFSEFLFFVMTSECCCCYNYSRLTSLVEGLHPAPAPASPEMPARL